MAYDWNAIQRGAMPSAQQGPGVGQQLAQSAAKKLAAEQAAKLGLGAAGTAIGGPAGGALGSAAGELAGPLASQLVGSLFNKGGEAKKKQSIWTQLKNKVSSDFAKRKSLFGEGKPYKPKYKAIGGMTPGPLGMSDMAMVGRDKAISAVKMKKATGDMSEEVEVNYHPPLAPKPKGE